MDDVEHMRRAMALAATVRTDTAPNPWVGSVVVPPTEPRDSGTPARPASRARPPRPGGPHAEVRAPSRRPVRPPGAPPCS